MLGFGNTPWKSRRARRNAENALFDKMWRDLSDKVIDAVFRAQPRPMAIARMACHRRKPRKPRKKPANKTISN